MGNFFSWRKKETPSATLEAGPGKDQALGSESAGHPALAQARESARASLESTARRQRRSSADKVSLQSDTSALPAALQEEINRQIEGALEPTAWASLLALPADTMLALTGREHWKVSSEERKTLGATGSAMARTMMIQNPRLLCALMLSSALFSVYMPRMTEEMKLHQAKRKAMAAKQPEKKDPDHVRS